MATAFDFVEDAPAVSGDFDFQPDPEESPSERPIIPAPGEPTPSMAQAPPLSPFEAGQIPTRVAQAQAAGPVPELTGGEIEQMVMTPQVTIPNVIPESWPIARGLFQTAKSIPEFLTAPAAPYVLMAQQIPLVREAVDAAMGAGMVKSAAELTGEASVTGDREKMTEAIGSGLLGATMLGAPHVAPMIANEIAARRVGPPDLARVDVEAFPGPANMIQITDVVEQAQRGGLFRQEALQGAKTITAPVPRGPRPVVPETPPEIERGLTVIQEIRAKGADTKEKIRALFPQLSRETAAKLRNQAFPKEKIPDNLSRQDVDRLFLDKLNEESNREIQQAFQENTGEPVAQVPVTPEPTPPPESPPMAPEAKAPPSREAAQRVREDASIEKAKIDAQKSLDQYKSEHPESDPNLLAMQYQKAINTAIAERSPVYAPWLDQLPIQGEGLTYGGALRSKGWAREGNLYVYKPKAPEPTPPAKVEAPAAKEPWQMTQQEWQDSRHVLRRLEESTDKSDVKAWAKQQLDKFARTHSEEIALAAKEGKPVPPEVLAEYPDLKPAAKPVAETPFEKRMVLEEEANDYIKGLKESKRPPKTEDEAWEQFRRWSGNATRGTEIVGESYFKDAWRAFNKPTAETGKEMPVSPSGVIEARPEMEGGVSKSLTGKPWSVPWADGRARAWFKTKESADEFYRQKAREGDVDGPPTQEVEPTQGVKYADEKYPPKSEQERTIIELEDQLKSIKQRRREVRAKYKGVRPVSTMNRTTPNIERGQAFQRELDNLEMEETGVSRQLQQLKQQPKPPETPPTVFPVGTKVSYDVMGKTDTGEVVAVHGNGMGRQVMSVKLDTGGTYEIPAGSFNVRATETPPTGPGISNGPGAARYGTPGTYSPISELTDQMATSPVKNLHEAIGVGERISDTWARGKDAFSRALGKLRVVPGALKRSWRNVRDLNEVEERVSALDWVLQQSSAKSKIAGEAIRKAIPASQVRDAMAIWIDAGGDEAAIRNTLANLPATTTPRVRRALEAALTLPDEVKTHASNLADYYARRAQEAQAEDVLHGVLEDYFTHVWKKPANMPDSVKAALNTGRVNEYFQYARQRKIPTLLEGILQGKEPVLDPAEVIPHYNYLMDRAIASRRFIKSLEDAKMPDGKPVLGMWGTRAVVGDPGEGAILIKLRGRPEDYNNYRQIDHPALRKWKWAATDEEGRPVFYEGTLAVHPEAYERLARMMDRSRLTPAKLTRALLRISGEVKGAKLGLLSPFHQVHLGGHALGHWTNPFFNLREIDWDAPATRFAVEKAGLKLAANPAELANFAEGILSPGLVHKIPLIGPLSKAYSEWLFTDYLPRLKLKTFENAWARNRAFYDKQIRSGKITEDQLAMRVGDAINNAYGELNQLWLGKHGRDPRLQRALRLGFLAPDFGEARLRFVGKALKSYSLEERLALGTLFATLYMSARVGNILSHGDPEIQDWKHAFAVKQGNRWYSMRSVLGDTLHAFANFPNFLYVRLNPAYARGIMEFFTGRDITGRKRTAGEQVIDELKQVVPIHLGGLTRDDQHIWESFLLSIGLGSQRAAPTAEVSQLASDWRKRRGIESRAETLSDPNSPYRKARIALEFGNRQDFHEAIRQLTRQHQARGDRTPRASIGRAFEQYYTRPFSGSARLEPAFKASLGSREKRKYEDALIERRRLLQQFRQWY